MVFHFQNIMMLLDITYSLLNLLCIRKTVGLERSNPRRILDIGHWIFVF